MIFSKEDFVTVAVLPGHRPSDKSNHNNSHLDSNPPPSSSSQKDYSGSSVYSLAITQDERFLFSGGADSLVKVWDLHTFSELYTVYTIHDIGDVFSVAWIPKYEVLALGSQNASIHWLQLYDKTTYITTQDPSSLPSHRPDRFFDSKGPGGKMAPQQHQTRRLVAESAARTKQQKKRANISNASESSDSSSTEFEESMDVQLLEIPPKNVIQYAHFGYVYSLLIVKRKYTSFGHSSSTNGSHNDDDELLVSGGGDGTVRFWAFQKDHKTFQLVHSLDAESSVFSLACFDSFLYIGLTQGQVGLYDMNTKQIVRVDKVSDDDDVMTMALYGDCLFRGGRVMVQVPGCNPSQANTKHISNDASGNNMPYNTQPQSVGVIRKWDSKQYVRAEWLTNSGVVLAAAITNFSLARKVLVTGGSDNTVSMWDVTSMLDNPANSNGNDSYALNSHMGVVNTANVMPSSAGSFNLNSRFQDQLSISSDLAPVRPVATLTTDHMLRTLRDFIAYKTVSGHEGMYANDCRRCAIFLRSLMRHFGADAHLVPVVDGNPIVVGVFKGGKGNNSGVSSAAPASESPIPVSGTTSATLVNDELNSSTDASNGKPCRVLFYGHYDVIAADKKTDQWNTEPFDMAALDGYLYGRGISDNKGPVLAAIFAVAELVQRSELENDVVFVIEGEEESGSKGFQAALKSAKDFIVGTSTKPDIYSPELTPVSRENSTPNQDSDSSVGIDWVLLSNSYWLDDNTPCLNYGLRGILKATVEIRGQLPDLHSGVHGGVYREPTIDLVNLLAKLSTDHGTILLPAFHDSVRPVDDAERKLYRDIVSKRDLLMTLAQNSASNRDIGSSTNNFKPGTAEYEEQVENSMKQLMMRWRYPSLTIHRITVSGPGNTTLIPQCAGASISLRIVPDQDISVIKASLETYLAEEFAKFDSTNSLFVDVFHEAEPWVGDPTNHAFRVLERATAEQWGTQPIYIREGGSIPAVRFLEKEFDAPAAQLPCGQASDGAHMNNERLRVINFLKTRNILRETFKELKKVEKS